MMERRDFLKGSLVVLGGLLVPFSSKASLTDVDRVILKVTQEQHFKERYRIERIQVHRFLYQQMNLRSIKGVRVEPLDEGPDQNGYIRYYWVKYDRGHAACGCKLLPDDFDAWMRSEHPGGRNYKGWVNR